MAIQGHPRSLILVPIDSVYAATSYWSPIVTLVYILPRFTDTAGFLKRTASTTRFIRILGLFPLD